jgi:stage V sporulation protein D (sporulation-specific penicillin-binding protein)
MRKILEKIATIFDALSTQSRIVMILWSFLGLTVLIVFTLAQYTLMDHSFYKKLADNQQLREIELSVNRGTIYGTIDPYRSESDQPFQTTILATTSIAKDLKIDPSGLCNIDMMEPFLAEVVYEHLCINRSQGSCFDNVLKYTNTFVVPENFNFSREQIIGFLTPTVREQARRMYKTRIFLAEWLNSTAINNLLALWNPGISVLWDVVYVDPTKFDSTRWVTELITLLGITPDALNDALELRKNRNVDIVEKLDPEIALKITDAIISQSNLTKQQALSDQEEFLKKNTFHKCLKLVDHSVRQYPEWSALAQITWFVDRDGIWRLGIEGYFQDLLAGRAGRKDERRDSLGRPIFDEEAQQEVKGADLYLTIDPNIQHALMKALEDGVRTTGANNASAIIMDPKTGAVRALGSYPTFDPDRPGNVDKIVRFIPADHEEPIRYLLGKTLFVESPLGTVKKFFENRLVTLNEIRDENAMLLEMVDPNKIFYIYENQVGLMAHQNLPLTSPYEPGSIFKWLTVAIGLDTGEIEPDMMYEDRGKVRIDEFTISNLDNDKCQGWHNFRNALNYSCNVGMINIVQRVGRPLFYEYLKKFGLGDITGLTLDGEHTWSLEAYEKWPKAKLFTMTFWQGIQVNLIQMAAAYSVLANGGIYMQPFVVEKREYPDGDTVVTKPVPVRRVINATTSQKITAMLTESTQKWFAKAGAVPGYQLAGKTGTSQIASNLGGFEKGENGRTNTSYAGYGPSQDPKFVIIVRFDRPRNTQYAEFSAAKTFKDIASFLLKYYGVQPYQP